MSSSIWMNRIASWTVVVVVVALITLSSHVSSQPLNNNNMLMFGGNIEQGGPCPFQPAQLLELPDPLPKSMTDAFDNITEYLSKYLNNVTVPSIAGSITYRGKEIYNIKVGTIDKKTNTPPELDTIYSIGSVTKVLPILQMYMLLQDGKIDSLDDELSKYAPKFSMPNHFSDSQPTLRQIASQLGGLPREAPCDQPLVCNISNADMLNRLSTVPLIREPNTYPSYSNLGYALLGRELTAYAAPDLTFEEWVQKYIFDVLGMKNSGFEYNEKIISKMATSYAQNGEPYPKGVVQNKVGWAAPCGSAYSTVEDLNILSNAIMTNDMFTLAREDFLLNPVFLNSGGQTLFGTPWEMAFDAATGTLVRRKGGNLAGFSTLFSFIPELEISGNFVFSGQTDEFGASKFYEMLLPPLYDTLKLLQQFPPMPTEDEIDYYVGTYSTGPNGGKLVIKTAEIATQGGEKKKVLILNILGANVLLRNSGLPSSKDGPAVKSLAIYIPKELLGCLAFELGALDSEYVYFGTASGKNDAGYVEVPGYLPGITYHREK